jgi:hypothetical protein
MIAFRAVLDPKKMRPNIITHAVQKRREFTGTSRRLLTREKTREKGRPSGGVIWSLATAQNGRGIRREEEGRAGKGREKTYYREQKPR